MNQINEDLDNGITTAEQIELELDAQIKALDNIYNESMDSKTRLKRYNWVKAASNNPFKPFSDAYTPTN